MSLLASLPASLPTVNLPSLILGHAIFMVGAALKLLFAAPRSSVPPPPTIKGKPAEQQSAAVADDSGMKGILMLAIGIGYLVTAYVPMEQNQFLVASVPIRLALSFAAGLRLLLVPGVEGPGKNEMLLVLFYDGLGGLYLGWTLNNFSGRTTGF